MWGLVSAKHVVSDLCSRNWSRNPYPEHHRNETDPEFCERKSFCRSERARDIIVITESWSSLKRGDLASPTPNAPMLTSNQRPRILILKYPEAIRPRHVRVLEHKILGG
jgi:hypothetical protein